MARKPIHVTIEEIHLQALDAIAAENELTRADIMRAAVRKYIAVYEWNKVHTSEALQRDVRGGN